MHLQWKTWPHGSFDAMSPTSKLQRQIVHESTLSGIFFEHMFVSSLSILLPPSSDLSLLFWMFPGDVSLLLIKIVSV